MDTPTFGQFNLHPTILKAIEGYTNPTPIQAQAIPIVLQGKDLMGAAQTGTGKTAAFTLPLLQRLMPYANTSTSPAKHPVRALILTPTRELAEQVADNVKAYSQFTGLRSVVIYGGVDIQSQKNLLRQGAEIIIATPGRLLDHLEQRNVMLSQVSVLVLDEADRMLDMGFAPDLERISQYLPAQRQGLLFSATFSPEIRKLARNFLTQPIEINVAPQNSTSDNIEQIAYQVEQRKKELAVHYLLLSRQLKQVIIFMNTKLGVSRLTRKLQKEGISCESIHGDRSQSERTHALEGFKNGKITALIATDVAARGLDVANLPAVINVDLPYHAEDYVHRIGRTGRAGAKGVAISLVSSEDEKSLQAIETITHQKFKLEHLSIPDAFLYPQKGIDFDPFFFAPYEPSEPESTSTSDLTISKKRKMGVKLPVLLGGVYPEE